MRKLLNYFKDLPPLLTLPVRRRYRHELTVISQKDTALGYVLYFPSEAKATLARKALETANNAPIVLYDKKVLPREDGWFE